MSSITTIAVVRMLSTVTPVGLSIEPLPCFPPPRCSFVELVTFAQSARFLACRSESSSFTVLQIVSITIGALIAQNLTL